MVRRAAAITLCPPRSGTARIDGCLNGRNRLVGFAGISALVEATLEAADRAGIRAEPASVDDAVAIDQTARSAAAALLPEIAAKAS